MAERTEGIYDIFTAPSDNRDLTVLAAKPAESAVCTRRVFEKRNVRSELMKNVAILYRYYRKLLALVKPERMFVSNYVFVAADRRKGRHKLIM
jgi:hypothetical protein